MSRLAPLVESHSTSSVAGVAAPCRTTWRTCPSHHQEEFGPMKRIALAAEPGDLASLRFGAICGASVSGILLIHHFAPAIVGWLFN